MDKNHPFLNQHCELINTNFNGLRPHPRRRPRAVIECRGGRWSQFINISL